MSQANKKETGVLVKQYLDTLLQKQMINQKTYDSAVKKFAAGGAVVDPLAAIQAATQPEVRSSQAPLSPEEQMLLDKKISDAEVNTKVQAEKTASSGATASFEEPEKPGLLGTVVNSFAKLQPYKEQMQTQQGQTPSWTQEEDAATAAQASQEPPKTRQVYLAEQGIQPASDTMPQAQGAAGQLMQKKGDIFSGMEDAIRMGAQAGMQEAAATSAYMNATAREAEALKREQILKQQAIAEKRMEFDKKIQEASAAAIEASQIDPNRFWNSRTSSQKLLATIGIILGGAGSVAIINSAIERDIDAQKSLAAGKQRAVNDLTNLYQQNMAALKDDLSATLATKDTMLQIAELKLKGLAAQTNNMQVRANAELKLGELQMERVKVQRELQQQLATQAFLSGGAQGGNASIMARLPKEIRELAVTTTDGQTIVAKTPDAQKKLSELEASIPNLLNTVSQLKTKIGPNFNPFSKEGQAAVALRNGLLTEIKQAEQLGALDKGLIEFADELIPDPTALNKVKTKAAYEQLEKRFKRNLETARTVYGMGYKPIKTVEPVK